MRVVVHVNHPAHVHLFKNFIWEMENRGHEVILIASEKEISFKLLNLYGFDYFSLGSYGSSSLEKIYNLFRLDVRGYKYIRRENPDIFIGMGSIINSHLAYLLRKPCITLTDTEHSWEQRILYQPFTDVILTPKSFKLDLGKKQVRYDGYHELAYLHPDYFTPDPSVLDEVGLSKDDSFIIVRTVSWEATHDIGHKGIKDKTSLVKELEKYGRVLITSEKPLPRSLEKYRISVSPEKFHDLLAYATLYVGEGVTVASEASMLGTSTVFISTFVPGYLYDQEKYGLVHIFSDPRVGEEKAIKKATSLLNSNNLKKVSQKKREKMLKDKIDVTSFMIWMVENYPESYEIVRANTHYLDRFK
jgi:uncharacterized protein